MNKIKNIIKSLYSSFIVKPLIIIINKIKVRRLLRDLREGPKVPKLLAAKELGNIGDMRAVNPLVFALVGGDLDLRKSAAEALRKIGEIHEVDLIAALKDESDSVRTDALSDRSCVAIALGEIGDARAVEPLIAALKDENHYVRTDVAEALGKIGDARAVEPLIAALKDESHSVRMHAAEALGKIGDARAVEPLIAALKDEKAPMIGLREYIRNGVVIALGEIGDARAVEPLIAALKVENNWPRSYAAEALGKIGDARAVEPLITTLKYYNNLGDAREALIKIGAPAVEDLIAVLKGEYGRISLQENVIVILGKIGTPAVEPLIAALKDERFYVRDLVVMALGKIGDARAVDPLIAALKDEKLYVRDLVVKALGKIGDARAVDPLIAALRSEEDYIASNVVNALEKITGQYFGPSEAIWPNPDKWQKWWDKTRSRC